MLRSVVASMALVSLLVLGASQSVGAAGGAPGVAAQALPATLDLDGAALSFDAVGQTVEPLALVEAPMVEGDTLTYRDVVEVDGYPVDAVIELVEVLNLDSGEADYTDTNDTEPVLEGAITTDSTVSPSNPGYARYRMAFYHGGTYTGPGTGDPVTLVGLRVHVYDVDNLQFVEFSGFAAYQLSDNTVLTVTPGSTGRTRFAEVNNTSTSNSQGTARTMGRVSVRFDAVRSFEYAYGIIEPDDDASYSIDLSADGDPWTDNVGGGVTPEVANPTLTLSSVGPASGSTGGGDLVTLTGAGFVSGTSVQIGGSPCANVVVLSATELTCRIPAGTGTVDVTVTNPDNSTAALPASFTYVVVPTPAPSPTPTPTTVPQPGAGAAPVPAPVIELGLGLNPDGSLRGRQVTVSGSGLRPGSTVTFSIAPGGRALGTATVGPDGTFTAVLSIPLDLEPGRYEVLAEGIGSDGAPVSSRTPFVLGATATAPGATPPARLAFTG